MKQYLIYKLGLYILLPGALAIASCQSSAPGEANETAKEAIIKAEKDFEAMAADKGIAEAFWFFADSNAVIKRQNDTLIHGKDQIRQFYSADFFRKATVKWAPDFVAVSSSGELAYTYGKYTWQSTDTAGNPIEHKGVFHTVWKKQPNGEWKYVWD